MRLDIEKTVQFIIEHQAQLTASAQKHDEQIAAVTDLVGRLAQAEIRLVERMEATESKLGKLFDPMDRSIQGLEGNGNKTR